MLTTRIIVAVFNLVVIYGAGATHNLLMFLAAAAVILVLIWDTTK